MTGLTATYGLVGSFCFDNTVVLTFFGRVCEGMGGSVGVQSKAANLDMAWRRYVLIASASSFSTSSLKLTRVLSML